MMGLFVSIAWMISITLWFLEINTELIACTGILLILLTLVISSLGIWNGAIYNSWEGMWMNGGLNMRLIDEKDILIREEYKKWKKGNEII